MRFPPAILALADGRVFEGISIGAPGQGVGELVFNTSMSGYQEMLSDPSYAHQIITLTSAHVGNVGCNPDDMESYRGWASGLVVRDYVEAYSNYRAKQSLSSWLKAQGIVAIAGLDTRALTQCLRQHGAINACISTEHQDPAHAIAKAASCASLSGMDLASVVSRQEESVWRDGQGLFATSSEAPRYHVVVYDFGVKYSILRILVDLGCRVTVVPAKTSPDVVLAMQPDGIVLSNGPGDPAACDYAITATAEFLRANIPLLGICLGFQILALACGAQAIKMSHGHHGANHPVMERLGLKRVFITSQNHGFAIDEASLPDVLMASHHSLFDGSLQGIIHRLHPAIGFQGHPESSPGPHEADVIFDSFIRLMAEKKPSTGV